MPDGWRMAGPGSFEVVDGALESRGGMGLLWYSARAFADFVLDLDWQVARVEDNSGVFVRFPDVGDDPWVAVNEGYEIQIHDTAPEPIHQTGGVYSFAAPSTVASNPPGSWNHFRIECVGQVYVVVAERRGGDALHRRSRDRGLRRVAEPRPAVTRPFPERHRHDRSLIRSAPDGTVPVMTETDSSEATGEFWRHALGLHRPDRTLGLATHARSRHPRQRAGGAHHRGRPSRSGAAVRRGRRS